MWTWPLAYAADLTVCQRKLLECRSTTKEANKSGEWGRANRWLHAASVVSWTAPYSIMEWTNAKVCDLIDLYRDRPVLWDCRMKEYKDRNKKLDALVEIAVRFGVDKDEVERKIKNLVCHFLREVKKGRDSIKFGAGSDGVYKSKWFCYNNMLFLKDRNQPKGMKDTITQDQITTTNEDVIEHESQNVDQDEVASKDATGRAEIRNKRLTKSSSALPGSQKKQKTSVTEEALSIMRDVQGRNASVTDQYKAFGDQVGLRIRDLPSSNAKTVVKHLISNILFEAEMGKYDNPFSASYSQPFPIQNYNIQQQCSPPMAPVYSNVNQHSEQPSHSGLMRTTSPQSVISPTPSVHSLTDK